MKALMPLVPYLIALLGVAGLGVAIDQRGYARCEAAWDQERATLTARTDSVRAAGAVASLQAQLQAEADNARVELRFVPIEKEVVRYVERTTAAPVDAPGGNAVCFGADELRLFNRAGAGDAAPGGRAGVAGGDSARGSAAGQLGHESGLDEQPGGIGQGLRPGASAGDQPAGVDRGAAGGAR